MKGVVESLGPLYLMKLRFETCQTPISYAQPILVWLPRLIPNSSRIYGYEPYKRQP